MHYRPRAAEDLLETRVLLRNLLSLKTCEIDTGLCDCIAWLVANDSQKCIWVTFSHLTKCRQYKSPTLGLEVSRHEGESFASRIDVTFGHFDLAKNTY